MNLPPHISFLQCPFDGLPMVLDGRSLRCENNHCHDIAKQGYLHLLPVQKKRSKQPGDSREMVKARHAFLNSGWYAEIAEQMLLQLPLASGMPEHNQQPLAILDAGCGEGYYIDSLHTQLAMHYKVVSYGLDISKDAILEAAKYRSQSTWLVASNRAMPLLSNSFDVLVCAFGFPSYDEFFRVLKPGGLLLLVNPNAGHLLEMKQVIYETVSDARPLDMKACEQAGFREINQGSLVKKMPILPMSAKQQLLLMSPHMFRANSTRRTLFLEQFNQQITIDVAFSLYQKDA